MTSMPEPQASFPRYSYSTTKDTDQGRNLWMGDRQRNQCLTVYSKGKLQILQRRRRGRKRIESRDQPCPDIRHFILRALPRPPFLDKRDARPWSQTLELSHINSGRHALWCIASSGLQISIRPLPLVRFRGRLHLHLLPFPDDDSPP